MAFKLRSQSPLRQQNNKTETFGEYTNRRFGEQKGYKETPTLDSSGKTTYKVTKNGKDVTGSKESQEYQSNQRMANLENRQDYETTNKNNLTVADPTGISSWGDAKRGAQHIGMMAKTGNWKKDRLLKDVLDIFSAVPLGNKIKTAKAGFETVKNVAPKIPKLFEVAKAAKNSGLVTGVTTIAGDKTSEAISNKNKK
jgi:hypothetical protein